MKFIKFWPITFILMLLVTACSKENLTTVKDDIPEVEPAEVTVQENRIFLGSASLRSISAQISTSREVNGQVDQYTLVIYEPNLNIPSGFFLGTWKPSGIETDLQNEVYIGDIAATFSQEIIDELIAWQQNGSDPDTFPTATSDDLVPYYASGMSIEITNVSSTTADVELSGSLLNLTGGSIEISGTFSAELL